MLNARLARYRIELLTILAHLDQLVTYAERVLAAPADTETLAQAEDVREMLNDMRASVEEKIDVLTW
jgi:hypothetical protein